MAIRSRCCGTHCAAVLLGGLWVPRPPRGCKGYGVGSLNAPRGFHEALQKLWGSPVARFQQSFTLSSTTSRRTVCEVHPTQVRARLHRRGPIAPSWPDRAPMAPIESAPLPAPRWRRPVLLDTVVRLHPKKTGVEPHDDNHDYASSASPIGSSGIVETYMKKMRTMTKKVMISIMMIVMSTHLLHLKSDDNHHDVSSASPTVMMIVVTTIFCISNRL